MKENLAPSERTAGFVGRRLRRKEDPRFLTGRGRFVDDVRLPGLLSAAFVRSIYPNAVIREIDATKALATPGVIAVITAEDIEGVVKPIRALCSSPGYNECDTPILARNRVRMIGDPIAIVVAESRYQAEDGAEVVDVVYEPLKPIVTIEDALAANAPLVHDEVPGNTYNSFEDAHGDVPGAFAAADLLVEMELRSQRCAPAALEARVIVADFDSIQGSLTIWASHQAPHLLRTGVARVFGMPENRIRVIAPDVGGGFGSKLILYPEDAAVVAASRLLGRPVKWACDRAEDLQTTMQGREQVHQIKAAASKDGTILAIRADIVANNGAYAIWPMTAGLDSGQASENITGPYNIPNYERKVRAVASNKGPMGPYRGVGRPMACFSMERVMDQLARQTGLDPIEIRLRNVIRKFPHTTAVGLVLESGSYVESLETLRKVLDYDQLRERIAAGRADGSYRGIGIAFIVEHTALGPQEVAKKGIDIGLGFDTASVRVEPDGKVSVLVGLHSHGQGHETTMAQITADAFTIDPDDVDVIFGDTAVVPYGMGTWASRSTVFCGGAVSLATKDLNQKMSQIAGSMLEVAPEDLDLRGGRFEVRGAHHRGVSFAEVARRANHQAHLLPAGIEPGLESTHRYSAPDPGSFSSALHAAVVEVDPDTGEIRIERYVIVEDCGTMINPLIIEGQLHGGVAQGLGHAQMENLVYDAQGQARSSTFMDYVIPGFNEVPEIEVVHLQTPSPHTFNGAKGMGESGAINPAAVIANAVTDALSPFGVHINETPVTPEMVLHALEVAQKRRE